VATQAAFLFVCTPIVFRILWGGALQIGENGDRPTRLSLNCAHDIVARLMLVMGAVAEIEAEHVCCRLKQSTYHLRARACRPERGYDLCVTAAVHD
jgi:hypothetical protein